MGVGEKLYHGDFQFNETAPGWYPQVYLANESGTFESHGVLHRIRPDGTNTLVTRVNAVAEIDLDMRRFPFDSQQLAIQWALLGFDAREVTVAVEQTRVPEVKVSQWKLRGVESVARPGGFVVNVGVERRSIFILRLVWLPLGLIVALSWSVFWMDRSSLGDRINVSFVGILTAVACQLVVGDLLPHVSYVTVMHMFLNVSFFVMCAGAVVNLAVGACDKAGQAERGDLIDRRCRRIFPLGYVGLLVVFAAVIFVIFPPG